MNRRDMLKYSMLSIAAATTLNASEGSTSVQSQTVGASGVSSAKKGPKIVIIGGGWGGLTVAKNLKKKDKNFDVLVIEKNNMFMSCPFSNTYLGKLEGVNLGTFIHDYNKAVLSNGYSMLNATVTGIDRGKKVVHTSSGDVPYDVLVLAPGIDYNYEGQFPNWSKEKIAEIKNLAPAALIPGSEHIALERMLADMDDGDVVITKPAGKYRCPPAPFERACMIAAYMKKEGINGKVIILNENDKIAKGKAFKEAWKELYGDKIVHLENCKITDVDTKNKTIHFEQTIKPKDEMDDPKVIKKSHKYEVLNLIPHNKANSVVEMAGIETTKDGFGKVVMNGCSFQTKTDPNIYAVGDVVGHAIPPSGQTAIWAGKQCAEEIAHKLHGKSYTLPVKNQTVKAGNVCYSMVGDKPEEGIMVTHDFSWTGEIIKAKGNVPKGPNGKFRSAKIAKATRNWYDGAMRDLF